MQRKKTVFLTGATGNLGLQALQQFLRRSSDFNVVVLAQPTSRDRRILAEFKHEPQLTVVWGDLTCYEDVLRCVTGADYVLHAAALVPPLADRDPELTARVNVGSIRNILQAIQAQPDPDGIKLVFIGSIAQTGDRNPPLHWGRAGDPIQISVYDQYAATKTIAEREVIESGLRYWVSLRLSGLLHGNRFNTGAWLDPIMFHVPMHGVFEWLTSRDAARLLVNVCEDGIPNEFWRRIYNAGGGCRLTNYELVLTTFNAFGLGPRHVHALFDPKWFALRNFHGHWFEDSDVLEDYLHFRSESVDDFQRYFRPPVPFPRALAALTPELLFTLGRKLVLGPYAHQNDGTQYWITHKLEERITAYFGSREQWEQIPGWGRFDPTRPSESALRLDHGYDESKPRSELDLDDMRSAAKFRGGRCLSPAMERGDLYSRLQWRCAFGHEFAASPALVLLAGHWCPQCLPPPWHDAEIAQRNPFFAQVWRGSQS